MSLTSNSASLPGSGRRAASSSNISVGAFVESERHREDGEDGTYVRLPAEEVDEWLEWFESRESPRGLCCGIPREFGF